VKRRGMTLIESVVAGLIGSTLFILLFSFVRQQGVEGSQLEFMSSTTRALSLIRHCLVMDLARSGSPEVFPESLMADGETCEHLKLTVTQPGETLAFNRLVYWRDPRYGRLMRGTRAIPVGSLQSLSFTMDRKKSHTLTVSLCGREVGGEATLVIPLPAVYGQLSGWYMTAPNQPHFVGSAPAAIAWSAP
jgi:hypothetical protein